MNLLEFASSLISSLAWPLAAVIVALLFRRQIVGLLSREMTRFKAGPFEAEWSAAMLSRSMVVARSDPAIEATQEVSPRSAIMTRFEEIQTKLVEAVDWIEDDDSTSLYYKQPFGDLLNIAIHDGMITERTMESLTGLAVLRNLTAHSAPAYITAARAAEFMAIAEAAELALDRDIREGKEWYERADMAALEHDLGEGKELAEEAKEGD